MIQLLTTQEAASQLRLQPRTLEKWRVRGGGPQFRKIGGRVFYVPGDLEAFIDRRIRSSTSDTGRAA